MSSTVVGDAVYREEARSYRSLIWSLVTIPVVFCLDLLVSGRDGALTHLPGWIIAGALLLGAHWLLLHAVRSTHSLRLTAEELVVGDEAIPRADIVAVAPGGGAHDDLVTLGWPNGFPRKSTAVTVRLTDDRDVLVPTRFPDRLRDALQLGAPEPEQPVVVRVAAAADLAQLGAVDERAGAIFRVAGVELPQLPFDEAALGEALLVLVVDEPVVGFAWLDDVDGDAYLRELSVLPGAMRRGHGTRLLETACAWAAERGYSTMTLTTFADVAWNAPFYAARGFVPDAAPGPGLRAVREQERRDGLDAAGPRVVMRRQLAAGPRISSRPG